MAATEHYIRKDGNHVQHLKITQVGNDLTIKKQIEGETKHCALKVQLTTDGAKVEQSPECGYFVAGICHFDSEGKELTRVK